MSSVSIHDPEKCQDGDDCKGCEITRLKARLKQTTATKRIAPEDKARALLNLAKRTAGLISGPIVALVLLLSVGCVAPEAIEQARTEAAVAHGHALDGMLPVEARMIGADEERAWRAQHRALTGDDVPGAETWAPLPEDLAPAPPAPGGGR